jgi:hypothetical protein
MTEPGAWDDIDWDDIRDPANPLPLLQKWVKRHCNGAWEHSNGISIMTCDNPGWWVKIDLVGTLLEGKPFEAVREHVSMDGHPSCDKWLDLRVEGNVWNGAGDLSKLNKILVEFLEWAAKVTPYWPTQ